MKKTPVTAVIAGACMENAGMTDKRYMFFISDEEEL